MRVGMNDEDSGIVIFPAYNEINETVMGFEKHKRCLMTKLSCPISGAACVECGLFRGRHVNCSFFKRNLEVDIPLEEIERRRREAEKELTAEKVWDIMKTPKKGDINTK